MPSPVAEIVCRRCGQTYALPDPAGWLVACPHCGKAPVPLWRRVRHNGVAAVLAVVALAALSAGVTMPLLSMSTLGTVNDFSLVGGIVELFDRGQTFLGVVLFTFSVVFPYAKLIGLLAATSALAPISDAGRHRLHQVAVFTGKYSLLDIIVVAMMIVLVKFQGIAEVRALPGTAMFCGAILLSILAGLCVNFDELGRGVSEQKRG